MSGVFVLSLRYTPKYPLQTSRLWYCYYYKVEPVSRNNYLSPSPMNHFRAMQTPAYFL